MGVVSGGGTVLVSESHTIGSIAVIRSLGRGGYKVLACSSRADALGFRSCYVHKPLVSPAYDSGNEFLAWLDTMLTRYDVQCIIPSEGFLLAVRSRFQTIRHLLPLSSNETEVYRGMSKFDLFDTFGESTDPRLGDNLPEYRFVISAEEGGLDLSKLFFPVYIKTDSSYSARGVAGSVQVVANSTELDARIQKARKEFSRLLLQSHVNGVGVGVFVLRWEGCVYARFMHRRLHEVPHTGGISSLRESYWNQAIYDDAIVRLEALEWKGVGMLEYRWDEASGKFYLIEFNGRFWGSLHLALYAGIDFPLLLVDAFFRHRRKAVEPRTGIKCRLTFPKEVEYVWSCLKDEKLSWLKKIWTIFEFFLLSIDPRVRSDMFFAGDRSLYFVLFVRAIKGFLK